MLADHLYHPAEDYLPLDEALFRIARSFRRVVLDRIRGDDTVRTWINHLTATRASAQLVERVKSLQGVTVWVTLAENDKPDDAIEFLLKPKQDIVVRYASEFHRQCLQPAVHRLADVLGYHVGDWMAFLDVTIECDYYPGIAEELTLHKHFIEAIQETGIGWIDEFTFGSDVINMTVMVADEDAGRKRIAAAVEELFPDVTFTIELPPDEMVW